MRTNLAKRNQNKYYKFHGEHGHTIVEFFDFKDEKKDLFVMRDFNHIKQTTEAIIETTTSEVITEVMM